MIRRYKDYLFILLICFFSFLINYYYASIGVLPRDNFVLYNGGYKVLNGYIPFNDYWLVTGPLLDYLNAFFFIIGGVSWKTYITHSSIFNSIISLSLYFLLINLSLKKVWCFFYSILFSVLMYSVVGTPFVDHHSTIFLILAFFLLVHGFNTNNYSYFIVIPFLLTLSFLSKQTPAAYGIIGISIAIIFHIFLNKKFTKLILLKLINGSLFALLFLFLFFYLTKININNFFEQYIIFASTIGNHRLEHYNFNLIDIIIKYKFISIIISILVVIFIMMPHKKSINKKNISIIISALILSILLVFHQLITFNQNYIFFLIPFLSSLIHVFYFKAFEKNKHLLVATIFICIFAVAKYHIRFNEHRKFNELEKVNISKYEEAGSIHQSLQGLKWITSLYPKNPKQEIIDIRESIDLFKQDKRMKTLITDYQFIAPSLSIHDFSPNQWYHASVSYPLRGRKYFKNYQDFFIRQLKKNKIQVIYSIGEGTRPVVKHVLKKECFNEKKIGEIITMYELNLNCVDFK